jgi:hypothetical protein
VARVLGNDAVREALIASPNAQQAWETLAAGDAGGVR